MAYGTGEHWSIRGPYVPNQIRLSIVPALAVQGCREGSCGPAVFEAHVHGPILYCHPNAVAAISWSHIWTVARIL